MDQETGDVEASAPVLTSEHAVRHEMPPSELQYEQAGMLKNRTFARSRLAAP
jgi:hypothetical protein